jgi:mRNA deadenylase 3'-5' endonuclease subunit Ccr4
VGAGGEMNQALYAHMNNKRKMKKKRHCLTNWIKKEDPTICCLQETYLINKNKHWLRVKGWKKIYQTNGP